MRTYWSNNQFFVNFRQFPAYTDDVIRTKMTRQIVEGLSQPMGSFEEHSEMSHLAETVEPCFAVF